MWVGSDMSVCFLHELLAILSDCCEIWHWADWKLYKVGTRLLPEDVLIPVARANYV